MTLACASLCGRHPECLASLLKRVEAHTCRTRPVPLWLPVPLVFGPGACFGGRPGAVVAGGRRTTAATPGRRPTRRLSAATRQYHSALWGPQPALLSMLADRVRRGWSAVGAAARARGGRGGNGGRSRRWGTTPPRAPASAPARCWPQGDWYHATGCAVPVTSGWGSGGPGNSVTPAPLPGLGASVPAAPKFWYLAITPPNQLRTPPAPLRCGTASVEHPHRPSPRPLFGAAHPDPEPILSPSHRPQLDPGRHGACSDPPVGSPARRGLGAARGEARFERDPWWRALTAAPPLRGPGRAARPAQLGPAAFNRAAAWRGDATAGAVMAPYCAPPHRGAADGTPGRRRAEGGATCPPVVRPAH